MSEFAALPGKGRWGVAWRPLNFGVSRRFARISLQLRYTKNIFGMNEEKAFGKNGGR